MHVKENFAENFEARESKSFDRESQSRRILNSFHRQPPKLSCEIRAGARSKVEIPQPLRHGVRREQFNSD
jgi:hypothetical protein